MKKVYSRRFSFVCAVTALLIGTTSSRAQECENDDDCPTNYACQVIGELGCDWTCPEDDECTQPQDCETHNLLGCVALPCLSDDQCADGMVCYESSWEECGGRDTQTCLSEEKCEEPELKPVQCETHTESECVPVYTLPCKVDTDCGEGFTCKELESCWCDGGSAGAGGSTGTFSSERDAGVFQSLDAGGAEEIQEGNPEDVPPLATDADISLQGEEPSCGCEPSGDFRCEIIETECSSESDCPKGWTCEANPDQPVTCGGPSDETSDEIFCLLDPNWISRICVPPYYRIRGIGQIYPESQNVDQGTGKAKPGKTPLGEADGDFSESPAQEDASIEGVPENTCASVEKPSGRADNREQGGCRVANIGGASDGILPFFTCLLGFLFLWRGRRRRESSRPKSTR